MTTLSEFDEGGRILLLSAPRAVLEAAAVADGRPSPLEFLEELSAGAKAFRKAQKDRNPLVREVANALRESGSTGSSGQGLPASEEAMTAALEQTEKALVLLRERDGDAAAAYAAWLVRIATQVSEAAESKVGGFFSRKVAVHPDERAFIGRLTAAVEP